ncbi:hypothetical protein [Streptomyces sp. WMMC897]|uniref:hypothetical protein n=1 Tax=Streptomyces sp. WMMC897 TaxID=3014782 RepID=UPI0022B6F92A|nr:hypothetical protein [Streptomyces sp. WMMC897]MCZ7414327.1 hypothetical protein [Streptomyces sp. WMMC897]
MKCDSPRSNAAPGPTDLPPARALRRCDRCRELTTDAVRLGVVEADAAPPRELYACPACAPSASATEAAR